MRKMELLVGGVFLMTGTIGFVSVLVGGKAAKWGELFLAAGMIAGGLLQWLYLETKK